MRWVLLCATAAVAATLWLPGQAAQPTAAKPAGADEPITFAQYRDWRDNFVARRRGELAIQLKDGSLAAARKSRLEQVKAYYDWLAGLPEAERGRRYRERFDQIDTDGDGSMDRAERAAWRSKRRALYERAAAPRPSKEAAADGTR